VKKNPTTSNIEIPRLIKASAWMQTSLPFVVSLLLLTAGCEKEDRANSDSGQETTTEADVIESSITGLSGQADDAAGESFAWKTTRQKLDGLAWLTSIPTSNATSCVRPRSTSCQVGSGTQSVDFNSCTIESRAFTLSGQISLQYSNNSCLLSVGENVRREFDWSIQGPRGGSVRSTSALRTDYRGTQIGGGGRLTRTASSEWQHEVLGHHKIATRSGRTFMDVSMRTLSPMIYSGTLARAGRQLTGGQIEVNHNLARLTSTISVAAGQPLVWSSSCCHPVSGRLDVSLQGSQTGQASVEFLSCGSAKWTKNSLSQTISLGYCD
jgi:hypothetical protein